MFPFPSSFPSSCPSRSLCLLPCSPAFRQSKVLVSVSVSSPDLFHVVLRYANRRGSDVRGRVSVIDEAMNYYCGNCEWKKQQQECFPSCFFFCLLFSFLFILWILEIFLTWTSKQTCLCLPLSVRVSLCQTMDGWMCVVVGGFETMLVAASPPTFSNLQGHRSVQSSGM